MHPAWTHATPVIPVILAGGSGTRLWPVSRETMPKHLVRLLGDESLLQTTARRVMQVAPADHVVLVGARGQAHIAQDQLAAIDEDLNANTLVEPIGRNTAAACGLAALLVSERFGPTSVIWICPSDHLVGDEMALLDALGHAVTAAAAGELVTFGITPTRPETGYGYIQAGAPFADGVERAARFIEKPDRDRAEKMLAAGGHYWNSGMFVLRADRLLEELARHVPAIRSTIEDAWQAALAGGETPLMPPLELFERVPSAPIDKAVMEHSGRVAVVPCDPKWSDVGSWHALWECSDKDEDGNAVRGDVVLDGSHNSLIHAEHRLVACSGIRDLAIVETRDAVLIADRNRGDAIRELVATLRKDGRSEADAHAGETRPWGTFVSVHEGATFKVKEIIVRPGGRLSLQSHRHRAEHWIVVAGTAEVEVDKTVQILGPNQSVHIPLGAIHRMANPGTVPMHLIEVQYGDYFGEDDIIRYEDIYGRS